MNNRMETVDFLSLVKLSKERTELAVDIWANDSGCLREEFSGCAVVLFPKGKELPADPKNLVPMSISEETEIWTDSINEIDLSPEELLQIKLFVRENRVKLLRLSDSMDEYDAVDFIAEMKTSGFYTEVNKTVLMTSRGKEEIVGPNSDGKLVLPNEWYYPEDDIYEGLIEKGEKKNCVRF